MRRARRSASACRSATAVRTPASSPPATGSAGRCPAGSSACRSTPPAVPPTASPCRPASSTSAGRRRPRTSAPRRCSSPSSRRCTPCTTAPRGSGTSPSGSTARPLAWPPPCGRPASSCVHDAFFDTLTVRVPGRADEVVAAALEQRVNLRRIDDDTVGIALDETTTDDVLARVARGLRCRRPVDDDGADALPARARRTTEYLTHPVFSTHRSETELLRYLRRLADMDIALDRSMIPLGSCTMKLNATTEMAAVTWPELGQLHPFCPPDQAEGYRELITSLEAWLGGDHRLRPRVAPAQRRIAGRAGRAPRDPRLPRVARRARPRRVPHPQLGPRHQRRVGGDGRHARGRGGLRRRRQRRRRRPRAPRSRSTAPTWRR